MSKLCLRNTLFLLMLLFNVKKEKKREREKKEEEEVSQCALLLDKSTIPCTQGCAANFTSTFGSNFQQLSTINI